jgi:hypothetical protein
MAGALAPLGADHSYLLDDKARMKNRRQGRWRRIDCAGWRHAFGTRFVAGRRELRPILTA